MPTPNQKFQMLRFAADCMQDTVMTIAEDAGMGLPARRSPVRDAAGRREEQPEPTEDAPEERGPADAPGRLDIKDIIDAIIAGEDRADEFLDNIKRMFAEGR